MLSKATFVVVRDLAIYALPALVVLAVWWRSRHWRALARAADRAEQTGAVQAGDVSIVHGAVESEDGAAPISIVIEQWRHQREQVVWSESARRASVHAFTIVTAGGERVLVEPDERTMFVAEPGDPVSTGDHKRTRTATLTTGAVATVLGVATAVGGGDGPYRSTSARVIRPGKQPVVVATLPMRDRFDGRAFAIANKAIGIAGMAIAVHLMAGWKLDLGELARVLPATAATALAWLAASKIATGVAFVGGLVAAYIAMARLKAQQPWYDGGTLDDYGQ